MKILKSSFLKANPCTKPGLDFVVLDAFFELKETIKMMSLTTGNEKLHNG